MATVADFALAFLEFAEGSVPSTPATGEWRTYFKSDGMYVVDDAGTEYGPIGNGVAFSVDQEVYNSSGATLTKGTPVYISGYNVGADLVEVEEADASSASTMPAKGIVEADITNNSSGNVVSLGKLADVDTSAWSVGDELFVSETTGELTSTAPVPDGSNAVQHVAVVVRSNASNGVLEVSVRGVQAGPQTTIVKNTQASSYTLVLGDAGKAVEMNVATANNLTVPPNSSVAFPVGTVVEVCQIGAGQTTIVAGAGVTVQTPETLVLTGQWSTVSLRKRATDTWVLAGDVEAAA